METIRFKNDTATRRRLFDPESFAHPAKGQTGMWQLMIERYCNPGDLVLDPMAGTGVTMLAALMGRDVVCVELESHFVEPMRRSWERMRRNPMLGFTMGSVVIIQGDARDLPGPSADCILTSPPYEGSVDAQKDGIDWAKQADGRKKQEPHGVGGKPFAYTRSVDVVLTSPPYEGISVSAGAQARDPGIRFPKGERTDRGKIKRDGLFERGYTRPVDAILTSPPYENSELPRQQHDIARTDGIFPRYRYTRPVDAILTSSPYEGGGHHGGAFDTWGGVQRVCSSLQASYTPDKHDRSNIGNLRSGAYWSAMAQVYAECWRVLRPGGILALVLKGFTRDSKYIDLPGQTEDLLLAAGWLKHDEWRRELWSLSFWRVLQSSEKKAVKMGLQMGLTEEDITEVIRTYRVSNGKLDNRLRFETVLAFKKSDGGTGHGVAAVLTSPPYEKTVHGDSGIDTNQHYRKGGPNSQAADKQGYARPVSLEAPWKGKSRGEPFA